MKTKWYISTLIIVFTFIGIYHNNISLPNQEIIVQFNSDQVTVEQSHDAIELIKQQLYVFGIDAIHVEEESNGNFRIAYHSSVSIESIKKSLASSEGLELEHSSFNLYNQNFPLPSDEEHRNYNLDIYEIQSSNTDYDLTGTPVIQNKNGFDRFFNPNVHFNFDNFYDSGDVDELTPLTLKLNRAIALAIDTISHTIPEVRAGPSSFINI